MTKPIHILFVCTGNTCRSPFAEEALRQFLKEMSVPEAKNITVSSAGLYAHNGQSASLLALRVAEFYHLDLSKHRSRLLTDTIANQSDVILGMTYGHLHGIATHFPAAKDKTFLMTRWLDGGEVKDPFAGSADTYVKVFEYMMRCLPPLAEHVLTLARE